MVLTNRVHIDAPAGIVDIEGEKDFVEGLLAKLFPLLEEAGFGSRPPGGVAQTLHDEPEGSVDDVPSDENGVAAKPKAKRKRNVAPKGHTCADRIIALKDDGFFKTKRSSKEIISGLATKGFIHKSNQVTAACESLFGRNMIQRTKEGSGPFEYFWDRADA